MSNNFEINLEGTAQHPPGILNSGVKTPLLATPTPVTMGTNLHPSLMGTLLVSQAGSEPLSVVEALTQANILASEWEGKHHAEPSLYHDPSRCCDCGCAMPKPYVIMAGPMPLVILRCDPCIRKRIDEESVKNDRTFEEHFGALCPPEFNHPWDCSKGNNLLKAEVLKRFSYSTRKGLLIYGASGSCKTRVVWELIKYLYKTSTDASFKWLMTDAFEIATNGIPKEAYYTPLLIIDDLGNEPLGPKNEKHLLYLIRQRCDWHKPIIVTTQLDGESFKKSFFSSHTGEAALRRFRERTEIINVAKLSATSGG